MPTADNREDDGAETKEGPEAQSPAAKTSDLTEKTARDVPTTPQSAPARTKAGAKKAEATLLSDFLRGKPSSNRPRRRSSAVVHTQVKASAVRQLRPPGGVKERVKQWQKASAGATPPDTPGLDGETQNQNQDTKCVEERQLSEDTVQVDAEEVQQQTSSADGNKPSQGGPTKSGSENEPNSGSQPTKQTAKPTAARKQKNKTLETSMPPITRGAPMKRVVSDSHWVNKNAAKRPAAKAQDPLLRLFAGPMAAKRPAAPKKPVVTTLPKDFTEVNNANPPTERKIQDWIQRSMQPASPTPQSKKAISPVKTADKSPPKKKAAKSLPESSVEDRGKNPSAESKVRDWVERSSGLSVNSLSGESKPITKSSSARDLKSSDKVKTPAKFHRKGAFSSASTDDIVVEVFSAISNPSSSPHKSKSRGPKPDNTAAGLDFESRRAVFATKKAENGPKQYASPLNTVELAGKGRKEVDGEKVFIRKGKAEDTTSQSSVDRARRPKQKEFVPNRERATKPIITDSRTQDTARMERTRRKSYAVGGDSRYRETRTEQKRAKSPAETSLSSLTSDTDGSFSDTTLKLRRARSRKSPTHGRHSSLEEIPVGYSAFSVLDLSVGDSGRRPSARREKPQRKPSLAGVPKVLKKVYNEGMRIVQDTVDPPTVVINQPRNIESWLNGTSDPFLESPTAEERPSSQQKPRHGSVRKPSSGNVRGSRESFPRNEGSTEDDTSSGGRAQRHDRGRASRPSSKDDLQTGSSSSKLHAPGLVRRPARRETGHSSPVERRYSRQPAPRESAETQDAYSRREYHSEKADLNQYMSRLPSTASHRKDDGHDISVTQKRPGASPPRAPKASRRSEYTDSTLTGLSRSKHVSKRGPGLKRRLTKHSDLMSVLSLPDTSLVPGRSDSIISASSLRTRRAPLATQDVQLIFDEVSADEFKYKREIETLVEGVIPVLLNSALSRLDAAEVSGQSMQDKLEVDQTRSIVEMGTALERIRSLHKSIPLDDAGQLACWVSSVCSAYDAYLDAWRFGYEDIVVNLAPACSSSETEQPNRAYVNKETDVVDVAYLLRRPLVRVKYLSKAAKGLLHARPSFETESASKSFEKLLEKVRRRTKEEHARKEDYLANNVDTTKARELHTLLPAAQVKVNQTRQVKAKEYFDLKLRLSSGQCLECQVEVIIRDSRSDQGDVLVCEVDEKGRTSLLFPPIEMSQISARLADTGDEVVIMATGIVDDNEWAQTFSMRSDQPDIAVEFVGMLGTSAVPLSFTNTAEEVISPSNPVMSGALPFGVDPVELRLSGNNQKRFSDSFVSEVDHVYTASDFRNQVLGGDQPLSSPAKISKAEHRRQQPTGDSEAEASDIPPTPPPHKHPVSRSLDQSLPRLHINTTGIKKRTSSPLKNEYQPSQASSGSSFSDYTTDSYDSDSTMDYSVSPTDSEATSPAVTSTNPSSLSIDAGGAKDSMKTTSEADAASMIGHRAPMPTYRIKFEATNVSCWRESKGLWHDVHSGPCSIIITPGLVEIFILSSESPQQPTRDVVPHSISSEKKLLEIQTWKESLVKHAGLDVQLFTSFESSEVMRLRTTSYANGLALFAAISRAGNDNVKYNMYMAEQQRQRLLSGIGNKIQEPPKSRSSRFLGKLGRHKSYRASVRAPSFTPTSSTNITLRSRIKSLLRSGNTSKTFNIEGSTINLPAEYSNRFPGAAETGTTPMTGTPPTSFADASTFTKHWKDFDAGKLPVRLLKHEHGGWAEMGDHVLMIGPVPKDMQSKSSVYRGQEFRIQLMRPVRMSPKLKTRFTNKLRRVESQEQVDAAQIQKYTCTFDEVLGSECFQLMSKKGIYMNVWTELRGPNGEIGQAPAVGGVSGRNRRFLLQCPSSQARNYIWSQLGAGGGAPVNPSIWRR